jgi:molecular chaperone GrpE (heat shock protein)
VIPCAPRTLTSCCCCSNDSNQQKNNSSSRSSATAGALVDFLPIYDKFAELKAKYAGEEFGNSYVSINMEATFSKMGVTEYAVEAGQAVDNFRIAVVESEYSTDFAKDTVIRPVSSGLELEGNVVRAALCVASSGAEEQAVSDEQE